MGHINWVRGFLTANSIRFGCPPPLTRDPFTASQVVRGFSLKSPYSVVMMRGLLYCEQGRGGRLN